MKLLKTYSSPKGVESAEAWSGLFLDKGDYYVQVLAPRSTTIGYGDSIAYSIDIDREVLFGATNEVKIAKETLRGLLNGEDGQVFTDDKNEYNVTGKYIGFGEAENFYELDLKNNSTVTLDLTNSEYAQNKGLWMNIYQYNAAGTGLAALVGRMTAKDGAEFVANLAAGKYVIQVIDLNAANGYSTEYDLNVKIENTDDAVKYRSNISFADAKDLTTTEMSTPDKSWSYAQKFELSDEIDSGFYKFDTAGKTGWYQFKLENTDNSYTFQLYSLADGAVGLTYLGANNVSLYLDDNINYYVKVVKNNEKVNNLIITDKAVDLSQYSSDNDLTTTDRVYDIDKDGTSFSYDTWVGYGDINSWTELNISKSGSFKLSVDMPEEDNYDAVKTKVTFSIFKMNADGSLTSRGTYTVNNQDLSSYGEYGMTIFNNLLLEEGKYYIKVNATNSNGSNYVSVTFDNNFLTKVDDNNNYSTAKDVVFAAGETSITINDWVGYGDMYDYYHICGADFGGNNQLTINIKGTEGGRMYAKLYKVTSDGSLKQQGYVYITNNEVSLANGILIDSNEDYVLRVDSDNASFGNDYEITFDKVAIETIDASVGTEKDKPITIGKDGNIYGLSCYIAIEVSLSETGVYSLVERSSNGSGKENNYLSRGAELYYYNESTGNLEWRAGGSNSSVDLKVAGTYYLKYNSSAGSELLDVQFDAEENKIITTLKSKIN